MYFFLYLRLCIYGKIQGIMNSVHNDLSNISKSFVNGTNDREAHPKHWVAVQVQMNCEKKVALRLDKLGIENFVAIQNEKHQWSDRVKRIGRIVIPMIVFVRISTIYEDVVRKLPFILRFITYPGSKKLATYIPDIQIDNLKLLLSKSETSVSIVSDLHVGDKVKVIRGPLTGCEGLLCMLNENQSAVGIRIDGLGYACVNISSDDITCI